MKIEVLKKLVQEGKRPMVRLTDALWDESFGRKGMIARVTSAADQSHDDLVEFVFDYNDNREHNLRLDQPNWFIGDTGKQGTAVEAGHFKDPNDLKEEVVFDPRDEILVEIIADETPLAEYLASGSKVPYVEWLEAKLEELVPECMKSWKSGLEPNTLMQCPNCNGEIQIHQNTLCSEKEADEVVVCPKCGQRIKV
jgi:predicted RNA-binding Zn-ribbon protein involved in translation (DUF1610 family)